MARKGLFREIPPLPGVPVGADLIARVQGNLSDAINTLTGDDDLIRSPVARLVASGAIPAGAAIAVYSGGAGQTLTLPTAAAQGQNVGAVLFILNISASTVTVARTGADLVAGGATVTVAAGALAILVSDGVSRWGKAP